MVDSVTGGTTATATHHHGHHGHQEAVMNDAAKALGISTNDLSEQLKSGKSLSDIAKDKGVSADDLKASIENGLKSTKRGANLSQSDLDSIAGKIADRKRAADPSTTTAPTAQPDDGSVLGVTYA